MTFNPFETTYRYNNNAQRWTDLNTGRFVSNQSVTDEMRRHQQATFGALDSMTQNLYSGNITLEQWQTGVAQELKQAHLAQSMFANGGKHNMTSVEYGRVGGTLADEYRYLNNFAQGIANGTISEAQAQARIRQYGKATQQSYWREYSQAREGKQVNWIVNPGENCTDCLDMESGNPHDAKTLDKFPGSGQTQCRGNCNCTLEDV